MYLYVTKFAYVQLMLLVVSKLVAETQSQLSSHLQEPYVVEAPSCGSPPELSNTRTNQSRSTGSFVEGYVLEYTCKIGYQRAGPIFGEYAICRNQGRTAVWDGPQISCNPVNCGDPGTVQNADRAESDWSFGNYVSFTCREGYKLSGNQQRRFCQADGRWSGVNPTCDIVTCSAPEDPAFGTAIYSSLNFGAGVRYECRNSRRVTGDGHRLCTAAGVWNGTTPTCDVVDCGLPSYNFTSGWARVGNTKLGDSVTYQCDTGETQESKCQYLGDWYPPPPACMFVIPTRQPDPPTGRDNRGCSNRFSCFFHGIGRSICSGLRRIGIRLCRAD